MMNKFVDYFISATFGFMVSLFGGVVGDLGYDLFHVDWVMYLFYPALLLPTVVNSIGGDILFRFFANVVCWALIFSLFRRAYRYRYAKKHHFVA